MIRALKIKFVTITMVLFLLIICSVFTVIYQTNVRYIYDRSVADLKTISSISAIELVEGNVSTDAKKLQYTPLFIVNIDKKGNVMSQVKSNITIDDISLKNAIKIASLGNSQIGTIKNMELRYFKQSENFYEKICFMDISRENKALENLFINLVVTALMTLISFFFIDVFIASWALKPVEVAWEQQKQFIADASHELKTPITVLLANMDILDDNKDDVIKNQFKWISSSRQEALQMKNLIEEMLFLAKTDNHKVENIKTKINISDILISQILSLEVIAFEKNVDINCDEVEEDLYINAIEKQIINLIVILLENACKYCDINTTVKVKLKREEEKIRMEINNQGPLIPKQELPHIFERFYRVEKSRNKGHGGYGLGLSIAKKITLENNMKIFVDSNKEHGTTFKIVMNRA